MDQFESLKVEAVLRVGRLVADYRGRHGQMLTQQLLADAVSTTRTRIAHLEEGRELLGQDLLTRVCEHLKIPRQPLIHFTLMASRSTALRANSPGDKHHFLIIVRQISSWRLIVPNVCFAHIRPQVRPTHK
jgi:hypothetical protein